MGRYNFRKQDDGRAKRKVRIDTLARKLLGGFPLEPDRCTPRGPVDGPPVVRLVDEAHRYLDEMGTVEDGRVGFELVPEYYRGFLSELAGNRNDIGRLQGVYVIHEAGGSQRALYVGSTSGATFRARLTAHLLTEGSLRRFGRGLLSALVALVESGRVVGEADEALVDQALRRLMWGDNRWAAAGYARTREEAHAVGLVSKGAFDITLMVLPDERRVLAELIERRLVEACVIQCGQVPPLQRREVAVRRKTVASAEALGLPPVMLGARTRPV